MAVIARFKVSRFESGMYDKARYEDRDGQKVYVGSDRQEMRTVILHPVYSDDPNSENKKFWEASPSGEIKLGTVNQAAWQEFDLDGEYEVIFRKIQK